MMSWSTLLLVLLLSGHYNALEEKYIKHLANINTDFGLRMYDVISHNTASSTYGNIFFSPFSISTAFGMLHLGSNATSRQQLDEVFGFGNMLDDAEDNVHAVFEALLERVLPDNEYFQLAIANRLFVAKNYEILPSYLQDTETYYNAAMERLDFGNDKSREHINSWVANETQAKIQDFIPPGGVDASTVMFLINAIYFKADWFKEFDMDLTEQHAFTNYIGEKIDVDMMKMTSGFLYIESQKLHAKVVELFYDGDKTSMLLFLPLEDYSVPDIVKELDHTTLNDAIDSLTTQQVELQIPRFNITQSTNLKPVLQHMGVRDIFTEKADLSLITGNKGLYVSEAFHKAFVKVDETGTEASAATGINIEEKAGFYDRKQFIADQPFLFLIRHIPTGSLLFAGRVGDPLESEVVWDAKYLTSTATIMSSYLHNVPVLGYLLIGYLVCVRWSNF